MTMDRHVEIADKLEAYALGQLPAQESREVDEHLRECSTCALEAHELAAVLTGIGESVPAVAPSAALRQRVLAAVAVEPQEPARFERQVGVVQIPRRRVWTFVPLAAAAVLVVVFGAIVLRMDQLRRELGVPNPGAERRAAAARTTIFRSDGLGAVDPHSWGYARDSDDRQRGCRHCRREGVLESRSRPAGGGGSSARAAGRPHLSGLGYP
jgi:anti-sigma factor RsiW